MNLLSKRLKEAMSDFSSREHRSVSAADMARAAGVSPATVNYWMNDVNGISAAKARPLAAWLGVDAYWLETGAGVMRPESPGQDGESSSVRALHPDDPVPDDVVLIPESRIEFSAGSGHQAVFELVEDAEPANYRLAWFQKERINPKRVKRFRVTGDSQEPFLFDRDVVLVNQDETSVCDGKLYAIRYGDDLRVKFLFRRLDGTLILRSMNPAYRDEEVSPDLANEHISIIGRVRDKSGKGGL